MKVVVTGATGFFGPAIVDRLRRAGHDAIGVSRRTDVPLDVTSADSCRALFRSQPGVDAVVHAAALAHVPQGAASAIAAERVNADGTANMVQAAVDAGVRRFVFISSVMVYGEYDLPPVVTEDTPGSAVGPYGSAKRRAEAIVARHSPPLETWTLRMSTMYAADWLFNVRKRVSPPVIGKYLYFSLDPEGRRYTLCSRDNGAEAVLWAVERRLPPGIYNVADQHVYTQAEILRAVEAVEGVKPHLPIPTVIPRVAASIASLMPAQSVRNNARSRYWKFCERNVYSSDRLAGHGIPLPPHLLQIAGRA